MNPGLEKTGIVDFRVRVPLALWPELDIPEENVKQYDAVLDVKSKAAAGQTLEDLLKVLDTNNIGHAVIHAEHEFADISDALNQTVADIVAKHPERFTGVGTVSLENFTIKRALRQVEECAESGFIGLSIQPAFFGFSIDDKKLYPVYAKAMEKNLLVAFHTGINYTTHRPFNTENPLLLDNIACDFPDLTIIASHAGWPWVAEMVAVARKHPNIYMEFGGLAPKYVGAQGGGWEVMYRFMNSVLADQILFATDWPTMGHQRVLGEWEALDLKPEVLKKPLAENAKRLIKKHCAA